jgi:gliding motility-associated-like protein
MYCNCLPALNKTALLIALSLSSVFSFSQLKADFTINNPAGCSPLTVTFTNTTANASSSATYLWTFGNGGTSNDKSPSSIYYDEKDYTVTLTVKDGNQTETKTSTITVYKKPHVDFTVSPAKGCAPLNVKFTSLSTPGDGTIERYFWDFGDGFTSDGATNSSVNHTYTFAQKPTPKLTVKNSFGCDATLQKSNILEVTPGVKAAFAADQNTLCSVPKPVNFTNTSTGPGALAFAWNFGDNTTSVEKNPAPVVYDNKGTYTVKLIVTSSEGCADTLLKGNYINAANFNSQFDIPSPSCDRQSLLFINRSTPGPSQTTWKFSDDNSTIISFNTSHFYSQPGNYTVQMINTYGTCKDTVTKPVKVNTSPVLIGYLNDKNGGCKAPLTVNFEDTTAGNIRWKWNFGTGIGADTSNQKKASFTFSQLRSYYVALTVTTTEGCQSTFGKTITVARPNIAIGYTKSNSISGLYGCPGLTIKFKSYPEGQLTDYQWNFGDGATSTDAEPEHSFATAGIYNVKLRFKTTGGCEDSITYFSYVRVYSKPKPNFESLSGLTICGNTPVRFKDLTDTATRWNWNFGDGTTSTDKNPIHAYSSEGQFTVTLISTNQYCSDTIVKPQFIKLMPPFTDITNYSRNCTEKGKVTMNQTSQGASKWTWDFGDGTAQETYITNKPQVAHTYSKSGIYKVVLFASNDQCTSMDTMYVSIMVKQNPVLTANKTTLCGNDTVTFTVSGLDTIRYYYSYLYPSLVYSYSGRLVYSDGTVHTNLSSSWYSPYSFKVTTFRPGEDSVRLITYDGVNGCYDTSNFVKFKISGPLAGFKFNNTVSCAGTKIVFTDTSKGTGNAAIVKWIWNFGDNNVDTLLNSGSTTHHYTGANYFYPKLKVIDANGCYAETVSNASSLVVYGPAVHFNVKDSIVSPNTPVQFFNTTETWPNYAVSYNWDFGDGSQKSTDLAPVHTYTQSGTYSVKLVAKSTYGCTDSLVKTAYIIVKTIKAVFTLNSSYINNNNCPPLVAKFQSTSLNADSLFWDFGDNSYSNNTPNPSHTYYQPGVYQVSLYAFGKGTVDSTTQQVTVKGPYGTIVPNIFTGCTPTLVTLTADAVNAVNFTWDFGDGYVSLGKDSSSIHSYTKPGIYQPKIIMKDAGGCSSTFIMQDSIIIDNLEILSTPDKRVLCDSGSVQFNNTTRSFTHDSLQRPLVYHWNLGTGIDSDTSNSKLPSFYYRKPSDYVISLEVQTSSGCKATVFDTVTVLQKPKGAINAVDSVCAGGTVEFKGAVSDSNLIKWNWDFGNGSVSTTQNPPAQTYSKDGNYQVQLIVYSTGVCADTVYKPLSVHANPVVNISPKDTLICKGDSLKITAHDGATYAWSSTIPINSPFMPSLTVAPQFNTAYSVRVTNKHNCVNTDSVKIRVSQPFKIKVISDKDSICYSSVVQLNAQGAIRYLWTPSSTLNNNGVSDPVAKPSATTIYTAVGYGSDQCFTDTASVRIVVVPLPQIKLGNDTILFVGSDIHLQPQLSNDVKSILWSPPSYLSCSGCRIPLSTPKTDINYVATVKNAFGCAASDTIRIKLKCTDSGVFLPNTFTPNRDGVNDIFYPRGKGVKIINYLRVFNRWGELVFEKKDFNIDDKSAGWDGTYKGKDLRTDVFAYSTEMVCDGGETFTLKGSIMIIR